MIGRLHEAAAVIVPASVVVPSWDSKPAAATQPRAPSEAGQRVPGISKRSVISSCEQRTSSLRGRKFQPALPSAEPQRPYGRALSRRRSSEFPPWRVVSMYAVHRRSSLHHHSKDALPLVDLQSPKKGIFRIIPADFVLRAPNMVY